MEGLRKKGNISKSKKNKGEMEMEEELVDYEHINKDNDYQSVTFDFLEPDHKYSSSLYMLTKKTFSFVTWDVFTLFDAICEQNELGIFLGIAPDEDEDLSNNKKLPGQGETDEIYALLTILNLQLLKTGDFAGRLAKFVLANTPAESQQFLTSILLERPEKTGLLINDRVINLPFMIVPNVFDQFMEDKKFIDTEYDLEEQYMYNFDYILYFVPCYISQNAKKGLEIEQTHQGPAFANYLYYKQEDKHLLKKALLIHEVPHKLSEEFKLLMAILKYEDFLIMVGTKSIFN